jgi:hypothetical protein
LGHDPGKGRVARVTESRGAAPRLGATLPTLAPQLGSLGSRMNKSIFGLEEGVAVRNRIASAEDPSLPHCLRTLRVEVLPVSSSLWGDPEPVLPPHPSPSTLGARQGRARRREACTRPGPGRPELPRELPSRVLGGDRGAGGRPHACSQAVGGPGSTARPLRPEAAEPPGVVRIGPRDSGQSVERGRRAAFV